MAPLDEEPPEEELPDEEPPDEELPDDEPPDEEPPDEDEAAEEDDVEAGVDDESDFLVESAPFVAGFSAPTPPERESLR